MTQIDPPAGGAWMNLYRAARSRAEIYEVALRETEAAGITNQHVIKAGAKLRAKAISERLNLTR